MSASADGRRAALIEVRGLTASYGREPALSGLDAMISAGSVVGVLGENGSGKSTFLKTLARIVAPTGGQILFEGRRLWSVPRRDSARRIAYVPQSAELVFPIRCLDLVLQGRSPRHRGFSADTPEDFDRAFEAMRACDVADLALRDASALSGGERRRVFLARALAQEADVWLLDEPTSGLDPRHRFDFLEVLVREHAARATTVLLVTHEIDLAAELSDRILLLRGGRTLASGTPAEALTPETIAAAFDVLAEVVEKAGRTRVTLRGKRPSVPDGPETERRRGAPGKETARPL